MYCKKHTTVLQKTNRPGLENGGCACGAKDFMKTIWNFQTGNTNLLLGGDFNCMEDTTKTN
jgi:hypothetical protein